MSKNKSAVETEQPKLGAWKEEVRSKVRRYMDSLSVGGRKYSQERFKGEARRLGAKIDEKSGNFSDWLSGKSKMMGAENLEVFAKVTGHRVVLISDSDIVVNKSKQDRLIKELESLRTLAAKLKTLVESIPLSR